MDGTASSSVPGILTPDQRPRVFISSTLQELAAERGAAREAVEGLRLIPVMFEMGARPHPARALYRAYLAQSHVFIGVYFERYGWVAPGEQVSGLEDEYRLSSPLPRLVYLKAPAPGREARLVELLGAVRDDDTVAYKAFSTAEELRRLIADDLAVLLAERFLGGGPGLTTVRVSSEPFASAPIPHPTDSLVGREDEISTVERLLSETRLLTIVGPGGIGKTRVALEAARRAAAHRPNDVAFVPLDAVTDPHEVLTTVATTIGIGLDSGVPVVDALAGAFGSRAFLLVLDNLEQVRDSGADLVALLTRCPELRLLVTSRAGLQVRGERVFYLGPLTLPSGHDESDSRGSSEAVRLFVDRARAVQARSSVDDPDEAAAVAELCRRLDGIPLAIELAAARTRLLPPRALLERLGSALDMGSGASDLPARQRTLRATLAWSEDLLTPSQRDLFGRLSVFSAPWTLADAAAVAGPGTVDSFDDVAGLVENSLVSSHPGAPGEPRFAMFQSVRAYAAELLSEADQPAARSAFVAQMAIQAEALGRSIASPDRARWSAEARLVWPDVRHAWELAVGLEDAETASSCIQTVLPLWLDGRLNEARPLIDATLVLAEEAPPTRHGAVLLAAATALSNLGEFERATHLLDVLAGLRGFDDRQGQGQAAMVRGFIAAGRYDIDACESELARSIRLFELAETPAAAWTAAFAHNGLGGVFMLRREPEHARREFDLSRDLGRVRGNDAALMQSLVFTAGLDLDAGDADAAGRLLVEASRLVEAHPFYEANAYCLEAAAAYAALQGLPASGARALGLAAALRDMVGAQVWALAAPASEQHHATVLSALDEPAYADAFAIGRADDPRSAGTLVRSIVGDADRHDGASVR